MKHLDFRSCIASRRVSITEGLIQYTITAKLFQSLKHSLLHMEALLDILALPNAMGRVVLAVLVLVAPSFT